MHWNKWYLHFLLGFATKRVFVMVSIRRKNWRINWQSLSKKFFFVFESALFVTNVADSALKCTKLPKYLLWAKDVQHSVFTHMISTYSNYFYILRVSGKYAQWNMLLNNTDRNSLSAHCICDSLSNVTFSTHGEIFRFSNYSYAVEYNREDSTHNHL